MAKTNKPSKNTSSNNQRSDSTHQREPRLQEYFNRQSRLREQLARQAQLRDNNNSLMAARHIVADTQAEVHNDINARASIASEPPPAPIPGASTDNHQQADHQQENNNPALEQQRQAPSTTRRRGKRAKPTSPTNDNNDPPLERTRTFLLNAQGTPQRKRGRNIQLPAADMSADHLYNTRSRNDETFNYFSAGAPPPHRQTPAPHDVDGNQPRTNRSSRAVDGHQQEQDGEHEPVPPPETPNSADSPIPPAMSPPNPPSDPEESDDGEDSSDSSEPSRPNDDDQDNQSAEAQDSNDDFVSAITIIPAHTRTSIPDNRHPRSFSYQRVLPAEDLFRGNLIARLLALGMPGQEEDADNASQFHHPTLIYTPTENSYREGDAVLLELIVNHNNEDAPQFLLIDPEDYPTGIIVMTARGIDNLFLEIRTALKTAGVTPWAPGAIKGPLTAAQMQNTSYAQAARAGMSQSTSQHRQHAPGIFNMPTDTTSSHPAAYVAANDFPLAGNPLIRGIVANKINTTQQARLFDLLSFTILLFGDHVLVNRITNCRLTIQDPAVLHQILNAMPSYDKLHQLPVLTMKFLAQLLRANFTGKYTIPFAGSAASSTTGTDLNGVMADLFLPAVKRGNDYLIQQVKDIPSGIEAIHNIRTVMPEVLQTKKSTQKAVHPFWTNICAKLLSVLQNRGEDSLDSLPGKQIHKIVNEHFYLLMKVIMDEIQNHASGAEITVDNDIGARIIAAVKKVEESHLSDDSIARFINATDRVISKIPALVQVTLDGKIIQLDSYPTKPVKSAGEAMSSNAQRGKSPAFTSASKARYSNPVSSNVVTPRVRTPYAATTDTTTPKPKNDFCISHLATGLNIPESKPCRHGDNCKLTHVNMPATGSKLHPGTKAKIMATIESRYTGNSTFKDNLLAALAAI